MRTDPYTQQRHNFIGQTFTRQIPQLKLPQGQLEHIPILQGHDCHTYLISYRLITPRSTIGAKMSRYFPDHRTTGMQLHRSRPGWYSI